MGLSKTNIVSVNGRRLALAIAVLAACAGCSRRDEAPSGFGASPTREYLRKVGQVRAQMNADNKQRIPAMIGGRDLPALAAEASQIDGYLHALAALGPSGIDPDALKFTQNFESILEAYKAVCLDSAELLRGLREAESRQPSRAAGMPAITLGSDSNASETIGAVNALLASLDRLDPAAKAAAVFLRAAEGRVSDDREKLRSAKELHHAFTLKVKAEFAQRYPGVDWASKDILP